MRKWKYDNLKANGDTKDEVWEHIGEVTMVDHDGYNNVYILPTKPLVPQIVPSPERSPAMRNSALILVMTASEQVLSPIASFETLTVWFMCCITPLMSLSLWSVEWPQNGPSVEEVHPIWCLWHFGQWWGWVDWRWFLQWLPWFGPCWSWNEWSQPLMVNESTKIVRNQKQNT